MQAPVRKGWRQKKQSSKHSADIVFGFARCPSSFSLSVSSGASLNWWQRPLLSLYIKPAFKPSFHLSFNLSFNLAFSLSICLFVSLYNQPLLQPLNQPLNQIVLDLFWSTPYFGAFSEVGLSISADNKAPISALQINF